MVKIAIIRLKNFIHLGFNDSFMLQRYEKLFLFILILNYLLASCHEQPGSATAIRSETMVKQEIKVGARAPDFTLPSQDGSMVSLAQFAGKKSVVLFFYPKDESYGCTKEACSFRDNYEVFREAGAEVIGISDDDENSHRSFSAHHKLPFILLSDRDQKVAGLYKVGKTFGILPGRATYVIDRNGIIKKIFSSQFSYEKHVDESLSILKSSR
jgi:peroxiredoxin Q/BCP